MSVVSFIDFDLISWKTSDFIEYLENMIVSFRVPNRTPNGDENSKFLIHFQRVRNARVQNEDEDINFHTNCFQTAKHPLDFLGFPWICGFLGLARISGISLVSLDWLGGLDPQAQAAAEVLKVFRSRNLLGVC